MPPREEVSVVGCMRAETGDVKAEKSVPLPEQSPHSLPETTPAQISREPSFWSKTSTLVAENGSIMRTDTVRKVRKLSYAGLNSAAVRTR